MISRKNIPWDLIRELAITDFKLRYQGSIIGYLWTLMKPLALFGVLYIVFTLFVRLGSDTPNYPVYLLLGIVLWSFFAETTNSALRSIVDRGDLIRKVYFPRSVIIISSTVSAFITLLLNLGVVLIFMLISGIAFSAKFVLIFIIIGELYILALGISFILSALYVKYRDIAHIWEVASQLLFYASAIIFPLSIIPKQYQPLILLNPITQVIQDARQILISDQAVSATHVLSGLTLAVPYIIPFILLVIGYLYFHKKSANFAEEV